uniref:Uncharacterized protein n=1 Tax=Colobus angolensis palliatus TaxID=336983 RepID=A0A2K5K8X9_COLAP
PTQCSTHHLTRPSPWARRPTMRPWLEQQPRPTPPASLLTTRPTWTPRRRLSECPPASLAWCAGTVPYVPGVLCVSCLCMWLPLMLTRWGTILARVGWDQTLFSSSPEIMLPKISSQTQPCEVAPERWGVLQGTSGVLLQLTLG